jgi:hypothetical protein
MAKESELGKNFWWWALGVGAAVVAGIVVIFLLIHGAWYRWGAFGTLIFFFVVILLVAWIYDRRQVKQYYEDPGL